MREGAVFIDATHFNRIDLGMQKIGFRQANEQFTRILNSVRYGCEPVILQRRKNRSVVLLSLEDYESLLETSYLLASRNNAIRLLGAIQQLEEGKGVLRKLKGL